MVLYIVNILDIVLHIVIILDIFLDVVLRIVTILAIVIFLDVVLRIAVILDSFLRILIIVDIVIIRDIVLSPEFRLGFKLLGFHLLPVSLLRRVEDEPEAENDDENGEVNEAENSLPTGQSPVLHVST